MRDKRRFLLLMLVAGGVWLVMAAAKPGLGLPDLENRLVRSAHFDALHAAYWAAAQGEAIVPLLGQLLENRAKYRNEPAAGTGAFPLNVLWALSHIPQTSALKTLEKYYAAGRDPVAALAIKGWNLRDWERNPRYGVLLRENVLLERPEKAARVLRRLKPGEQVRIIFERSTNPREVGPRGGPVLYDRVELLPIGDQGFIPRAGDDFSPFM